MKLIHLHVGMVQTNCYVFYDENTMEGAVVDPGDNAAAILREISRVGADIKYILLTHGHFDHILAVHEISEKTGAKLVIHKDDERLLSYDEMGEFRPFYPDAGRYPRGRGHKNTNWRADSGISAYTRAYAGFLLYPGRGRAVYRGYDVPS